MEKYVIINGNGYEIDRLPDKCPFCHNFINPKIQHGYIFKSEMEIYFTCPKSDCHKGFIGYYYHAYSSYKFLDEVTFGTLDSKNFSENISAISPSFVEIYNEAYQAEQYNLHEICGVGYRKALEFLIKDYSIKNHPDKEEKIKKDTLSNCINIYVSDANLKNVAKRAVWLGNDETHYVRKWEGKNLTDLKKLIEITIHWIEMEVHTNSFLDDMPE